VVALGRAGVVWTWSDAILLAVCLAGGAVYFGAIFVATATVAFWWVDSGEFANGFTYGGRDFASYPINVYNGFIRGVLGNVAGLSFVAYYPALWLLDRDDPLGLPRQLAWGTPAVAAVAVILAAALWRFGVRRYRSTGS
jgi:ABC-2 type transport system permease protein